MTLISPADKASNKSLRRMKSRQFSRACPTRKRRYMTRAIAYHAFIRMEDKARDQETTETPIDIYRCHICFGWHLTTKGQSEPEKGGAVANGEGQREEEEGE